MCYKCSGGGEREVAARTDAEDAISRLDHVSRAGNQQCVLRVDDGDHGFESAQCPVGAPFFSELRGRAWHVGGIILEFCFEAFEQRECICGAARKTRDYAAFGKWSNLYCVCFH